MRSRRVGASSEIRTSSNRERAGPVWSWSGPFPRASLDYPGMTNTTAAASVKRLLLDALDQAFDKRSWHGPNLTGALRGLSAAQAAARLPGRKSVWEQALHAAYWKQRVLNKLAGPSRFPRKGSDWPPPPAERTEAAWKADVALLHGIHRRLREAVA